MSGIRRRNFLTSTGIGFAAANLSSSSAGAQQATHKPLDISEYEPKSTLRVKETFVERARYPVIDVHTHLSFSKKATNGVPLSEERNYPGTPQELLQVMDRKNLRAMVNLTGGYGKGLRNAIARYDTAFPGRFYTLTEPWYSRFLESNYPSFQAGAIEDAHRAGAKGLKILKTLGLYLRENITSGKLVKIDDPRFDPMWDACGQLNMPVAIHISDPVAFF